MNLATYIHCWRKILGHPASPAPLIVVFIGYWLPLEWMLQAEAVVGNCTWLETVHVIASSVLLNFLPAAILGAVCVYALAGLLSLLPGISFQNAAEKALRFITYLSIFAITARASRRGFVPLDGVPMWITGICLLIFFVAALWLTVKGHKPTGWMSIPRLITIAVLPLALVLVLLEAAGLSAVRVRSVSSYMAHVGRQPDIILITVDTLAEGHLHSYGYERPTSPHLDDFSSQAILFENFYADANWTRPGVASILNGARPWTHRGDLGRPLQSVTDAQNLVNLMADAGYEIDVVNSNILSDIDWQRIAVRPTHRAMLYPHYGLQWLREPSAFQAGLLGSFALLDNYLLILGNREGKTEEYVPQAETMLRSASSHRPLFFWMHIVSPHAPYATPAPYLGRIEPSPMARTPSASETENRFTKSWNAERRKLLIGRYDEAILMADDVIGHFLDLLKSQRRFDRSLIVVTADHGESFNSVYGGHGGSLLTEELIRVPCMIKPPFYHGSRRESMLFEQADIAPTILSFANLPIPAGMEGQAYSVKPENVPVFSMNHDLQIGENTLSVAVREGDWKYVIHLGRWKHPWPQRELYNLTQDPKETTNLVDTHPPKAELMRQRIMDELARHNVPIKDYGQ